MKPGLRLIAIVMACFAGSFVATVLFKPIPATSALCIDVNDRACWYGEGWTTELYGVEGNIMVVTNGAAPQALL